VFISLELSLLSLQYSPFLVHLCFCWYVHCFPLLPFSISPFLHWPIFIASKPSTANSLSPLHIYRKRLFRSLQLTLRLSSSYTSRTPPPKLPLLLRESCCTRPERSELSTRWLDLRTCHKQVNSTLGLVEPSGVQALKNPNPLKDV